MARFGHSHWDLDWLTTPAAYQRAGSELEVCCACSCDRGTCSNHSLGMSLDTTLFAMNEELEEKETREMLRTSGGLLLFYP